MASQRDGIQIRQANCTRQETVSSPMSSHLHPCHVTAAMLLFSPIFHTKYTLTKPHTASDWSPQPRSGHAGFDSTEWDKKTICEALEILQLLQLLPFTAPVLAILSHRSK